MKGESLILLAATLRPHNQILPFLPVCQHHRNIFGGLLGRRTKRKEAADNTSSKPETPKNTQAKASENEPKKGGLAPSSIFEEEDRARKQEARRERKEREENEGLDESPHDGEMQYWREIEPSRKDPDPRKRLKWERNKVIQSVRNRFRMKKSEKLLRSERSSLAKSPMIKTSVKKLGPLARQIAGKPLTEAMIQMRFSKKRAATDVLRHLEYARNQAIVQRNMGLGQAVPRPDESGVKQEEEVVVVVEDKKGKKRLVTDRSAMYIDQAWVGRGKYEFGTDFRARGRAHRLYLPYTSKFSLGGWRSRDRQC